MQPGCCYGLACRISQLSVPSRDVPRKGTGSHTCLPSGPELVEASRHDLLDVLVVGDEPGVDDGLDVLLDLVELVAVGAISARQAAVVQERQDAAHACVEGGDDGDGGAVLARKGAQCCQTRTYPDLDQHKEPTGQGGDGSVSRGLRAPADGGGKCLLDRAQDMKPISELGFLVERIAI